MVPRPSHQAKPGKESSYLTLEPSLNCLSLEETPNALFPHCSDCRKYNNGHKLQTLFASSLDTCDLGPLLALSKLTFLLLKGSDYPVPWRFVRTG